VKTKSHRIAAIDIGSNTVHMVIMDLAGSGLPEHRSSLSVILKLGEVVSENGTLPSSVYDKLRHTLKRFIRRAQKDKVSHILIAATQAMRSVRRGKQIAANLSKEIGYPIHLLSAAREAELGFFGS